MARNTVAMAPQKTESRCMLPPYLMTRTDVSASLLLPTAELVHKNGELLDFRFIQTLLESRHLR